MVLIEQIYQVSVLCNLKHNLVLLNTISLTQTWLIIKHYWVISWYIIFKLIIVKGTNLILFPIQFHSSCMRKKKIMSHYIGFCSGVPMRAISDIVRTSTRCLGAVYVPPHGKYIWLVNCDPILHSITKFFETKVHIVAIIIPNYRRLINC